MYFYKRNPQPNPWHQMARFQREMNQYFDQQYRNPFYAGGSNPLMNVYTNAEGALVLAEVPGLATEDLEINVVGETLTLSGERVAETAGDESTFHRQERVTGKFSRSIELPFPVEVDKVDARLEKGLLTIRLPRAEEDKPRRITVKN